MRSWLVIAAGENRAHRGNDGYDDDPSNYYTWDDTVGNHNSMKVNDRIVLWDKQTLLGVSIIEEIDREMSTKSIHTCPNCGASKLKARTKKLPRFYCSKCRNAFENVVTTQKEVLTSRCRHDAAYVDLTGQLSGDQLRHACLSPKSQLSIRELDWSKFVKLLEEVDPLLQEIEVVEKRRKINAGGHREVTVRVRIGQQNFRKLLLAKFGPICAFTGPLPKEAIDAAHLYSYAKLARHDDMGGLLLRKDLHVFFDKGLIAVNPTELRLDLADSLMSYPSYKSLQGAPLKVTLEKGHLEWIKKHWQTHRPKDDQVS
jgi:ribosomal protein S27AE